MGYLQTKWRTECWSYHHCSLREWLQVHIFYCRIVIFSLNINKSFIISKTIWNLPKVPVRTKRTAVHTKGEKYCGLPCTPNQLQSYRDNLALNRLYPSIKSACLCRPKTDIPVIMYHGTDALFNSYCWVNVALNRLYPPIKLASFRQNFWPKTLNIPVFMHHGTDNLDNTYPIWSTRPWIDHTFRYNRLVFGRIFGQYSDILVFIHHRTDTLVSSYPNGSTRL